MGSISSLGTSDEISLPSTIDPPSFNNLPSRKTGGSRGKNWCFTLNNYDETDSSNLLGLEATGDVSYLIFGYEKATSTGTPHLQGFVSLAKRLCFAQVKKLLSPANPAKIHIELTRHVVNAIAYCQKEGNWIEFGSRPTAGGRRSDLDLFKASVNNGIQDFAMLRELHTEVFAKYPRFCIEYVADKFPTPKVQAFPLRPWQSDLYDTLKKKPDDRKILFIVDYKGNSGKTWFSRYYAQLHNNVQIILPGKKADMAYILKQDNRVLFIDAPRSKQGEFIQYDFLEEIKNGLIFSGKYESKMKYLSPIHVVVMMNEQPDKTKLSNDRWDIRTVG